MKSYAFSVASATSVRDETLPVVSPFGCGYAAPWYQATSWPPWAYRHISCHWWSRWCCPRPPSWLQRKRMVQVYRETELGM